MRTFLIALTSALLFTYVITELSVRIWPGDNVALAGLVFVGLLINGLFNLRLDALAQDKGRGKKSNRSRGSRERNSKKNDSREEKPSRNREADSGRGNGRSRNQKNRPAGVSQSDAEDT